MSRFGGDRLWGFLRRSREVIVLAAVTGALVGGAVRLFEFLVIEVMYEHLLELPLIVIGIAPVVGLAISALLLRYPGRSLSPTTADEYLIAYHEPGHRLGLRPVMVRLAAAVATLGSGGALGLEGPSLYGGSALGQWIQRRLPAAFRGIDHRTLLVAGAAAGVAAVFKAPATGAIFAIEVPSRDDVARRALLPALVASASGYLVFVVTSTTEPIFRVVDASDFAVRDLLGAVALGVTCAIGARWFARLIRWAKGFSGRPITVRLVTMSIVLVVLFVVSRLVTGENLTIGSGYEVITRWLSDPDLAIGVIVLVVVMRCVAAAATLGGGGVGGVFIPLVVAGALVGRVVGEVINPDRYTWYTFLGMAAFLGAGYRVPLAAVMFVAETTGKPGFVVPALFAAVTAELVMGDRSVTGFQRRSTPSVAP